MILQMYLSKGDPLGLKGHPVNDTKQSKEAVTILPTCYSHSKNTY